MGRGRYFLRGTLPLLTFPHIPNYLPLKRLLIEGSLKGLRPFFESLPLMQGIHIHIMERGIKVEDPRFFELFEG